MSQGLNGHEPRPQPLNVEALFSRQPPTHPDGRRVDEHLIRQEPSMLGVNTRPGGYHGFLHQAHLLTVGDHTMKDVMAESFPTGVLVEVGGTGSFPALLRERVGVQVQHHVNINVVARANQETSQGVPYSVHGPDINVRADVLD
ncbi:MAG: hypothetical protein AAB538_00765, partial [Patescibacteria group bacterium]